MSKYQMIKEALIQKLNITNFEDEFLGGVLLNDSEEDKARKLYEKEVQKSFILRNPWLTGIPTLGMAPLLSANLAHKTVAHRMMKDDPFLYKNVQMARKDKAILSYNAYKEHLNELKDINPVSVVEESISKAIKEHNLDQKALEILQKKFKISNKNINQAPLEAV